MLGDQIGADNIDKYLLPIIAVIIFISLIPPVLEYRKHRRKAKATRARRRGGRASSPSDLHDVVDE